MAPAPSQVDMSTLRGCARCDRFSLDSSTAEIDARLRLDTDPPSAPEAHRPSRASAFVSSHFTRSCTPLAFSSERTTVRDYPQLPPRLAGKTRDDSSGTGDRIEAITGSRETNYHHTRRRLSFDDDELVSTSTTSVAASADAVEAGPAPRGNRRAQRPPVPSAHQWRRPCPARG